MTAAAAPTRREMVTVMTGILMTVVMSSLDQSAVVPALPAIARELHGLSQVSWVVSAYLLTSTALTLVYGKLADAYGKRMLMMWAVVVFVAASLLCAIAHDVLELILARALQGAGACGLIVMSQTIMADLVAPRERARYAVFVTTTFALTSAAGPPLGGYFVDHLTWRWIFWLNLPFGLLALLVAQRFPNLHVARRRSRLDYVGLLLLTSAATALLLIASWGGTLYRWTSPQITVCFVGCVALFAAFVARERRAETPIFPPRLFANPIVVQGDATVFIISMLMFGAIVLVPVFLQLVGGVGAGSSGALLVPMLIGMAAASTCASQFMRRTGRYKPILPIGLTLTTVAYFLLSRMTPATSTNVVVTTLLLLGLSIGGCIPTINVAIQNSADPRDLGIAISTVTFSRSLGGAFGAAIFWSLLLGIVGRDVETASIAVRAQGFRDVFLVGTVIAAVTMLTALRLREEPLKTTRPSERAAGVTAAEPPPGKAS